MSAEEVKLITGAAISAVINALILGGLPVFVYAAVQSRRHSRSDREIADRTGFRPSERKYILFAVAIAAVSVALLLVWPPKLEAFLDKSSPQHDFIGLRPAIAIPLALLYGVVKTGLPEEMLFRGLIAGSLARHLPFMWANVTQALIFLLPHLLVVRSAPDLAWMLPLIFVGALVLGWLRIRSGSIVGPWIIHAALNVATCLSVSMRTAP